MLKHNNLEQLTDTIKKILQIAKSNNVKCEAMANLNSGLSVNVRSQTIDTIEFNNNKKISITVYVNQNQGSVATTEFDEQSLENSITKAIAIAKFTNPDPYAGLADPTLLAKQFIDLDLYHPQEITPSYAVNTAKLCEQAALDYDSAITNTDGTIFTANTSFLVMGNSYDFIATHQATNYSLTCAAIASHKDLMQRDFDFTIARRLKDLIPLEEIGKQAANKALSRLGAKKIATCKTKVLFSPRVASELFAKFVAAITGNNIANKSTFLLDSLGTNIFPNFVNIIDDPFIKRGLASSSFDNDGIATKKQFIISNGKLNTYLLDNYFAKKLNMQPTGHSGGIHNLIITSNINSLPTSFPSSTDLKPKNSIKETEKLIKKMHTGLIVTETIGDGVDLVTGSYSKGAFGFWVENGKIVYPVEEITIAGNLNDLFKNILAVGTDLDYRSNIIVGSVLIDNLTVAGTP